MADLVPFALRRIGNDEVNTVNAQDLYTFLKLTTDFTTWIRRALKRANLVEGIDYRVSKKVSSAGKGGRPSSQYFLTEHTYAVLSGYYQSAPKDHKSTYLYLVRQASTPYRKIGIASDYKQRLSGLQNGNPCRLYFLGVWDVGREARMVEKSLHTFFQKERLFSEWFSLSRKRERQLFIMLRHYPRVLVTHQYTNDGTTPTQQLSLFVKEEPSHG